MNKLTEIQIKLKAPKSQYNSFGNYKYRNCEDILEAIKPILAETATALIVSDEIIVIGERFYVKATAQLFNDDGSLIAETSAFAREPEFVKGQSEAQITGASSSYARKYALNGLFAIDDTKDSDTTNTGDNGKKDVKDKPFKDIPDAKKKMTLEEALETEIKTKDGIKKLKDLTDEQLKIGKEQWTIPEWKEGAELILLYKEGQHAKG